MSNLASLPTQYSSATVGDIANWVAVNKLRRPELIQDVTQIAFETYLTIAAKVPFECFQLTTTELPIVAGTDVYDMEQQQIGSINRIQSVRMTYVPGVQSVRLLRNDTRGFDAISFQIQGRPYQYARWGSSLQFYPIPDSASYTYRLRFYQQPQFVTDSGGSFGPTPIVTPPEWNKLYKLETLYETYIYLDEFEKAHMLMEPSMMPRYPNTPKRTTVHEVGPIPRLWNDLLETISMRERGDEDFSINPIYRPYSAGTR